MRIAFAVLAVILLLVFLPTCFVLQYSDSGVIIYLRLFGIFKINLTKDDSKTKKKKYKTKKKEEKSSIEKKDKKKLSLSDCLDNIQIIFRIALRTLGEFCKHFKMYKCKAHILVAGDDPADVALEFGLVNASIYSILSLLEDKIKIKKKDICVFYDYDSENSKVDVDFRFRVLLLIFLVILICVNFRDIMTLIRNINKEDSHE